MLTNVTLTVTPSLLRKAREKAMAERRTLNDLFRDWVGAYVRGTRPSVDYQKLMTRLHYAQSGRKFTREEMNER
jgi:hypothetical protein